MPGGIWNRVSRSTERTRWYESTWGPCGPRAIGASRCASWIRGYTSAGVSSASYVSVGRSASKTVAGAVPTVMAVSSRFDLHRLRLVLLGDQPLQRFAIGCQQLVDAFLVHVGDDDLADLLVHVAENAVRLHLFGLIDVVFGRRHVVHDLRLEPVDQPEVDDVHQPLLAHLLRERVLVTHREDV